MKKIIALSLALFAFTSVSFAQRVAFVDTEYILENISEYREAQAQLEELSIQWQKEIEAKFAEIEKLYQEFQAEAVLLPEEMKRKKEDEIVEKEKEAKQLQKKRFGKGGDLYKKREELIKPIQDKVFNAVEELATESNYAIIFDKAGSMTILYGNSRYDKSDDVLEKLGYQPGAIQSGGEK